MMKKMMQKQLKNLPKDQADKLMSAFEKDPKFFQDIAKQIQKKVKNGADQQNASMQVMMENRERLQELMK